MTEVVTQRQSGMPSLPSHSPVHNEFRQYTELMHWMKDCENQRFVEVCEVFDSLSYNFLSPPTK